MRICIDNLDKPVYNQVKKSDRRAKMDAKKFLDELDAKIRNTGSNQASHVFAQRAMNVITTAYDLYPKSSEFGKVRKSATPEQIARANELIEMGFEKAIFGAGRDLLQK